MTRRGGKDVQFLFYAAETFEQQMLMHRCPQALVLEVVFSIAEVFGKFFSQHQILNL
jgi:hypothetical protein